MFSDPEKNIGQLGLQPGQVVADLGAGSGFYSFAAAKALGPDGRVYAVEVQQDMLGKLTNDAHAKGFYNVEAIWGDIERIGGTKLAEGSVSAVIAANVMFQLEDRTGFAAEVARILKKGGRALVIDWTESFNNMGPHKDHVVTREEAEKAFRAAGLEPVREIQAGDHHYGIIFKKQ